MLDLHRRPPQTQIPDDVAPNRTGYSNEQLAIRTLAEVVSGMCMDHAQMRVDQDAAGTDLLAQLDCISDVFRLTEPS